MTHIILTRVLSNVIDNHKSYSDSLNYKSKNVLGHLKFMTKKINKGKIIKNHKLKF